MEIGPWRMHGKGGLKMIEGGWDEYAHVLYRKQLVPVRTRYILLTSRHRAAVDQPVGTGFSYASTDSYVKELDQVRTLATGTNETGAS